MEGITRLWLMGKSFGRERESKKSGALVSGISGAQLRQASIGASSVDGSWPAAAPGLTFFKVPLS